MIDPPTRAMPEDVVVEISCDDAGSFGQKGPVLRQRAPQRTELMLATDAGAGVLRPDGEQIACDGPRDVYGGDMANGRVERLRQPGSVAVAGEDGEPFVAIVADPYRVAVHTIERADGGKTLRLCALANDGDIGPQTHDSLELAMQRHSAVPGNESHGLGPGKRNAPGLAEP